jgi:predicted ArsR family transcriptional regulator
MPRPDISAPCLEVLDALAREHEATAITVGEFLGITPAGVRRHLRRLLAAGYIREGGVHRQERPDIVHRPPRWYELTDAGKELLKVHFWRLEGNR